MAVVRGREMPHRGKAARLCPKGTKVLCYVEKFTPIETMQNPVMAGLFLLNAVLPFTEKCCHPLDDAFMAIDDI
ncbi:MAG: hypothetical protein M0R21_05015 [Lentimicrobiaceae bacterium]|nr:hypothetical protein [Lentimicrobiaceae bacterium]